MLIFCNFYSVSFIFCFNQCRNEKNVRTRTQHGTTEPPTAKGVSRTAISKYLKNEMDYDNASALKKAFQNGVTTGKLIQSGQSFRVAGDPAPDLPPEETVGIKDVKIGKGGDGDEEPVAKAGDTVIVAYEGHLESLEGPVFDSASKFDFVLGAGDVIKGWDMGVAGMRVGGKRELTVPSKLGYGKRGSPPDIPPNADLYFLVTLKAIVPP